MGPDKITLHRNNLTKEVIDSIELCIKKKSFNHLVGIDCYSINGNSNN